MKLIISSFLFLIMVVVPAILLVMFIIFAIRNIQKDAEEQGDTTLWTSKEKPIAPKPPVPSKYIEERVNKNVIHLRTVYIPYPISHNIEEIVTSVSDSEYKLGYMFDTMYSEKTDSGLVLFMRFKLL